MSADVRRDLRKGAKQFFESIPQAELGAEVRTMKRERARLLHGLLPSTMHPSRTQLTEGALS